MRYLSLLSILACAALLACGQEPAPTASGPAGKASASADCTLAEIFSGKEGCQADPSLDVVPEGYVPPVDTTATAPADTLATAPAASDSTGTGTETPSDTSDPESETPSGGAGAESETPSGTAPAPDPEPVVPEPVVVHVPGDEEEEPETARSEEETLTADQSAARTALSGQGVAYTAAAFVGAARNGRLAQVKLFVQAGMSVDATDSSGIAALLWAASGGHLEVVKYLVGQGASLTATYSLNGYTALHYAAYGGDLEMVKYLVGAGADVNATAGGDTPRDLAVALGETAVAEYLYPLTPRGRLESAGIAFTTQAFVEAAGSGNLSAVSLFVQAGMDKEGQALVIIAGNGRERTALHAACAGGHLAVVTYLVNAGASVSSTDGSGGTALHAAVGSGNLEIVKLLVSNGAAVNAKDSYSETPLYHAASYGHLAIVTHLVDNGADVTIASHDGLVPYGVAWLLGHAKSSGWYSFWYKTERAFVAAAERGDLAQVKFFVASGMGLGRLRDSRGGSSYAALHLVAKNGHLEVVKYLVGAGADVNVTHSSNSMTPLHLAAWEGRLEVVKYLVGAGADVTLTEYGGRTALHYAAWYGYLEVVKVLVGAGSSLTATDLRGLTVRNFASSHAAVVEYLDSLDDDDE